MKDLILAKMKADEYSGDFEQFKKDLEELIQQLQDKNDYAAYTYQDAWNAGYQVAKAEYDR